VYNGVGGVRDRQERCLVKLLYVANARLPTEKAHGVQIVKMCEAFTQNGAEVELLAPFRVQTAQMRRAEFVDSPLLLVP